MDITTLLDLLSSKEKMCIQAGHFAIIHDKESGKTVPAVWEDLQGSLRETVLGHPYMGIFPGETWKVACKVIEKMPTTRVTLLVNDWQFVRKSADEQENIYRRQFYESSDTIPIFFSDELKKIGRNYSDIQVKPERYASRKNSLYFSEVKLRDQFSKKLKTRCSLAHGCAQEYLPFLLHLHGLGFKTVVNFIPITCMGPILESTRVAQNDYQMDSVDIVNIFANGADSPSGFWLNAQVYINGEKNRL